MPRSSFRDPVDATFHRAAKVLALPSGLQEKIRVRDSTHIVRFGVRLRGEIHRRVAGAYRSKGL